MNIHSVAAVYFSATDTTKTVVSRIAQRTADLLDVPVRTVDFTLPGARKTVTAFAENELVIFGVPVYAGRIPNLLLPFVQSGFSGKPGEICIRTAGGQETEADAGHRSKQAVCI